MKMFQHIKKKWEVRKIEEYLNHRTSFTETEIYENETLKNDSILSDYERIQFIENGLV
jgi:hypothetical protein